VGSYGALVYVDDLGAVAANLDLVADLPAEKSLGHRRYVRKRSLSRIGFVDTDDSVTPVAKC
jgi:hypothetical protein